MNNIKNKHNLCFLVLVVSFVIGWKVLADTPWPGVNLTFGLCLGIIVYLAALTYVDGPLGPLVVRGNLERIGLPDKIIWSPEYLSPTEFILILGQGLSGLVTVDLTKIPHILLGGSTGSGKTILLKLLLRQCVEKDASLYIADFKGGLDFPGWEHICHMVCDDVSLYYMLQELAGELETRKEVLRHAGCANLQEYNTKVRHIYKRIVFACDEVAEVLDKTGRNKEDKERIDTIIGYLSTIARQGRAVGIHLILSMQRPDASILPGQIKNNIDCRICGRADGVLSQIVLDSTEASDAIPKDAQGRFLMADGTVFQGFWSDELDDWFLL